MTEKPEVQKPVALDLFLPQNVVARLDNWRRQQPHPSAGRMRSGRWSPRHWRTSPRTDPEDVGPVAGQPIKGCGKMTAGQAHCSFNLPSAT